MVAAFPLEMTISNKVKSHPLKCQRTVLKVTYRLIYYLLNIPFLFFSNLDFPFIHLGLLNPIGMYSILFILLVRVFKGFYDLTSRY